MDETRNIALIGMPGVGKSTVGVLLAKQLGYSFLDTDIYIQTHEGKNLQQIIEIRGLDGFIKLEAHYILSISVKAHVLATGGSVVYSEKAMQHLKNSGVAIHLDINPRYLKQRLGDLNARGVVIAPDQDVDTLYNERRSLYLQHADATIVTDGLNHDKIVRKIIDLLT
jgi:shikimate kinase